MQKAKQQLKNRITKASKELKKYYTADELNKMITNTNNLIDEIDTKRDLEVITRYHQEELENLLECNI